jgi:DNA repair exonuclease SbcCD ATPase subunit
MTTNDASRTSYLGLIRLQKLAKARHELELSRLNAKQAAIQEENKALFRMQEDRFAVDTTAFVPVHIIMKRLEANKSLQAQLSEQMVEARRNLLKTSRTLDTLDSRLRDLAKEISRAEVADETDEYMGHLLGRHAI